MIIAIDSCIGFSVITSQSLALNTLNVFRAGGMQIPSHAGIAEAIQCSRNFADGLKTSPIMPDRTRQKFPAMFSAMHERLRDQIESEFPPALDQAFKDFQRSPTITSAALYFDLLTNILEETKRDLISPGPPKKPTR